MNKKAMIRGAVLYFVATTLTTNAATVSVNLVQSFQNAQTVDPNTPYGVEEVGFWTNVSGNGPSNLRDDTNTSTTLDLSVLGGSRNTFGGNAINGSAMKAGQAFFTPGAGPSFTISEIPYTNYKVIVYLTGYNASNTQASISDGATTYWWRPQPFGAGLNQTSDTNPGDGVDQASYAVFGTDENPLSGSSVTLQALLGPDATAGAGVGGFQIVEVEAIPEPSTGALALMAIGALALRRQRKC